MTLKVSDCYRHGHWLSPRTGKKGSPSVQSETLPSINNTELLHHTPTMLRVSHFKQRGCFVGNHYLHVLHGYSSAPEFSSDKTGVCPCTLWPRVLDLLVSKCLGRTGSKSSGTSLLGHVPFEAATKMQ